MKKRKETNRIILHHTLTKRDCSIEEVREWHKQRGFDDVGYHFLIRKDGTVEEGRDLDLIGAHAKGRNADSIGIALAGDFSKQIPLPAQLESLKDLTRMLSLVYGLEIDSDFYDVLEMHRDDSKKNPCPGHFFQAIYTQFI